MTQATLTNSGDIRKKILRIGVTTNTWNAIITERKLRRRYYLQVKKWETRVVQMSRFVQVCMASELPFYPLFDLLTLGVYISTCSSTVGI